MGLQGALVDLAHTEHRAPIGPKNSLGETPMGTVVSVSFKCRPSKPSPEELRRDSMAFVEYTRDITLLLGLKDTAGNEIELSADWKIVVENGPFAGTYEIVGDPDPIRAKRRMLGWNVALREFQGKEPEVKS